MSDSKLVRFTQGNDDPRKLVFEPHDTDGYWTLTEYQLTHDGWRFVGDALVTGLLIRDGDSVIIANGEAL